ncbi:MAG: anthranilate phosphoribosyltransferase [Gammaproteobacteria bacterium]|nr:anthranilate phosphoribosyltransferase [Gammaproteobacteria bacterium]
MNIQQAIKHVAEYKNLSAEEMEVIMRAMMQGEVTPAQMGGFLMTLRMKGETTSELLAAVKVMRSLATPISLSLPHLVDTCGTGGDSKGLFNVSTACAFVVAAAGGKVAKHGNRSNSSSSGSADLLEALGASLESRAEDNITSIAQCGFGFLFAPFFHPAMKHAAGPRKELGTRTLFNLLGPLCNPAHPPHQLIGVFEKKWVRPFAKVLKCLGSRHALVVYGEDGCDEVSLAAPTYVAELKEGLLTEYTLAPEQLGKTRQSMDACVVKTIAESKQRVLSVLKGEPGPSYDLVALNAGAAIYAADLTPSLIDGVRRADHILKNGLALKTLACFLQKNSKIAP